MMHKIKFLHDFTSGERKVMAHNAVPRGIAWCIIQRCHKEPFKFPELVKLLGISMPKSA